MGGSQDPDKWVLDDQFVRGGRHEASARTRDAVARMAGEKTSWRQPAPSSVPLDRRRRRGRVRLSGRRWVTALSLCVGLVGFGVWIYRSPSGPGAPVAGPTIPVGPTVSGDPTASAGAVSGQPSDTSVVDGISPGTPAGTCFSSPAGESITGAQVNVQLSRTACTGPHEWELIAVLTAAASSSYPAQSYWDGPVAADCTARFRSYAGLTGSQLTTGDGRHWGTFVPTVAGWSEGDRTVYCLVVSEAAVAGSARVH